MFFFLLLIFLGIILFFCLSELFGSLFYIGIKVVFFINLYMLELFYLKLSLVLLVFNEMFLVKF